MPKKIIGYNVYRAADGCDEEYYGFAESIEAAKSLAETGKSLEKSMYSTADAAGHCGGLRSSDKSREAAEPAEWFGADGWDCAVAVYAD